MIKFVVNCIGWLLMPVAIVVVAYEVAKCFVESKVIGRV